jgi:hypothetical protein
MPRSDNWHGNNPAVAVGQDRAEQRLDHEDTGAMDQGRQGCRAAIVEPDAPHAPISREQPTPRPDGVMTASQQGISAREPAGFDRGG